MDFRRQDEDDDDDDCDTPPPPAPPPPTIREPAFGRPMLSPSSSLLSSRGGGGGARNGPDPAAVSSATAGGGDATAEADAPIRYRECLRNHAASLGGHVLDGCCEFMSSSDDAFKCAACGCHRSFHRIDTAEPPPPPLLPPPTSHSNPSSLYRIHDARVPLLLPPLHPHPPPPSYHHHQKQFIFHGSSTATESSSEDLNAGGSGSPQRPYSASKKRFRTKFTAEQKERMLDFAERLGWRIQKQDEAMVEDFCAEVGVSRQVLKVWMHNNKHSVRKQQQQQQQQQEQQPEHQDI